CPRPWTIDRTSRNAPQALICPRLACAHRLCEMCPMRLRLSQALYVPRQVTFPLLNTPVANAQCGKELFHEEIHLLDDPPPGHCMARWRPRPGPGGAARTARAVQGHHGSESEGLEVGLPPTGPGTQGGAEHPFGPPRRCRLWLHR